MHPIRFARAHRRVILAILGWTAVGVAAVGVVLHYVPIDWQPALAAATWARYLMLAVVVGAVLLGFARQWYGLAAAIVVLLVAVVSQSPLYLSAPQPGGGQQLTILQADLRAAAVPSALVAQVRREHVDVLTTEELTAAEANRLETAGLGALLPYRYLYPGPDADGVGIWSRYPLDLPVDYPGFTFGVVSARAELPDRTYVTVFAVHLAGPLDRPRGAFVAQRSRLGALLDAAAGPVVAGGDFAATPDNPQFRELLTRGYSDAATDVGAGYLASYPAGRVFPPLIAVDHVLCDGVSASSARTLRLRGSDHRALLVAVTVP